jgi:PAS domain S-box-containing protein
MLIVWLWILKRAVSKKTRELKESEEHHRSILQTAMNGIWLADVRGCLIEVNKSYCQMSGYSEQELLTMSISDLEANESVDDTANRIQTIKERGELHFESRQCRKDGTVFDVEVRVKYQPANGGQYIAFLQDITERKRTEESIVNSNKLLQAIISNAPMRIFWKDTELRYLGGNHVFAMDAGVGCPDDLIGKDDYQLVWKDQAELYRTDDLMVIESGIPKLFYEEPQTKPEGNQIWLRSSKVPIHNEANEIIGVLGMYEDITERKLMEEELILFFDLVPDMVCIASTDGYFKKLNRAWKSVLGYTQEELLTTRFKDFIHPDDIQATMIEVEKQIAGESTINFTNRYRCKDGSYRWLEWKATPAKNKSTLFAAARDITERKRAEETLRKKDADIEQFLYTVSHDLRSPLVTVKTFMGYLEKDITDGNQKHLTQDIQFIHGAADKMKLMLDELLELYRIGRVETPKVRVSFREVLAETIEVLAGSIREQKLDIRLPDSDLMLFGEHQRFCQIWQNLIENALKYRRDDSIPCIELGLRQNSGETVFFVKDNGIGIDPQYQKKIFGIFDKLDPKSPGAGLGLSMVQRVVEKYSGRIWVESDGKDKGSCFCFTLPDAVFQS